MVRGQCWLVLAGVLERMNDRGGAAGGSASHTCMLISRRASHGLVSAALSSECVARCWGWL